MDSNLRRELTYLGKFPDLQHHTQSVLLFLSKEKFVYSSTLLEVAIEYPKLRSHILPLLEVQAIPKKKEEPHSIPYHSPEQCQEVLRHTLDIIVDTLAPIPFLNTQEICIAGGAVRDLLVGRSPKDIDVFVPIKDTIVPLTSSIGERPRFILEILRSAFEQSKHHISLTNWYSGNKLSKYFTEKWGSHISTLQEALDYPVPSLFLLLDTPDLCPSFPGVNTQVIFQTSASTAKEVLSHFDLDISGYGVTLDGMVQSSKAPCIEDLIRKSEGSIPVEMYSYWGISVADRIQSFEDRGWDMSKAKEFVNTNPSLCEGTPPHLGPHLAFY